MSSKRHCVTLWQALAVCALLIAAACGQTGPLVLPGAQPQPDPPAAQGDAESAEEEDEE